MKLILKICDDDGKTISEGVLLETGVVDEFGNVFTEEALLGIAKRTVGVQLLTTEWEHNSSKIDR